MKRAVDDRCREDQVQLTFFQAASRVDRTNEDARQTSGDPHLVSEACQLATLDMGQSTGIRDSQAVLSSQSQIAQGAFGSRPYPSDHHAAEYAPRAISVGQLHPLVVQGPSAGVSSAGSLAARIVADRDRLNQKVRHGFCELARAGGKGGRNLLAPASH